MNIMEIVSGTRVNGAILHCLLLSRELARRGHRVTLVCRPGAGSAYQAAGAWDRSGPLRPAPLADRRVAAAGAGGPPAADRRDPHAHQPGEFLRHPAALAQRRAQRGDRPQPPLPVALDVQRPGDRGLRGDAALPAEVQSRPRQPHRNDPQLHRLPAPGRRAGRRPRPSPAVLGIAADDAARWASRGNYSAEGIDPPGPRAAEDLGGRAECPSAGGGREEQGPYAEQVRAAAEQLGVADRITWTGHRDDAQELLAGAGPLRPAVAWRKACRWSILEAMAVGLPVVASAWAAFPSAWSPARRASWRRPAQSEALAEAVLELLGDPARRRRLGEAGRRRVAEQFAREPDSHASRRCWPASSRGRAA